MECALYCPVYGYYEKEGDTVGRRGDYYTSVSVGPLFGQLLARQFSRWLRQLHESERPSRRQKLRLMEAGAHDGTLARDILRWLDRYEPALVKTVEYCLVEPSDRRQVIQRKTLQEFASRIVWVKSLEALCSVANPAAPDPPGVRGILFSNELFDAMPLHRLGWDKAKGGWFEWGVTVREGRFEWVRLTNPGAPARYASELDPYGVAAQPWPQELLHALPEGFTIEVCPAANRWWAQAAAMLQKGKLVTLDYGLEDFEWFSPARQNGTLRAYYRHQLSPDVLSRPGEQDLTAHVNFSALARVGASAGLKTEALVSQEKFLTGIAAPLWESKAPPAEWTAAHTRQFQTLTHPGHFGRSFRVLVQSR